MCYCCQLLASVYIIDFVTYLKFQMSSRSELKGKSLGLSGVPIIYAQEFKPFLSKIGHEF